MSDERMARYFTRVHASNRHAGYGVPVEVLASSRREAVSRAIALGWSGHPYDARVTIDKVVDEEWSKAPDGGQAGCPFCSNGYCKEHGH